jgi:hypothetical protein
LAGGVPYFNLDIGFNAINGIRCTNCQTVVYIEYIIYHFLNNACLSGRRISKKNQFYLFNRFRTRNIKIVVITDVAIIVITDVAIIVIVAVIHYYDMLFYIPISKLL